MLIEKIRKDMQDAKRNRETTKANLLSTLYGEMFTQSKSGKEFTEDDELKIIRKFMKNADETLSFDIAEEAKQKLLDEKKILESYLPGQLSKDEIDTIVTKMTSEGKTIKEIMPFFKENFSGRYDGRIVSEIVKSKIS
ncbi:MAG: GatB/YqeY domain-containing protein [Ignavibacteria bacterium]|nr:GatB/YqeY domain-containing protein [Ignavibacteria bacterium]MCC7158417.1 GatB/YqeY domain-containing protein [Ignavibacteria bacterium]